MPCPVFIVSYESLMEAYGRELATEYRLPVSRVPVDSELFS